MTPAVCWCVGRFGGDKPPHPTARKDADDRERLEWFGDWDLERVDLAEINQFIGRVRVKKANTGEDGGD